MPAALFWDQPTLKWDSTATWDAAKAPTHKTMNPVKAIISFREYTSPDLSPLAQHIHDKMTEHAVTFASPPTTMASLQTLITDYDGKLAARASNSTEDVMLLNQCRELLEQALSGLGSYVNTVAKGDPVIVEMSGFPFYETARTPDTSPPAAPTDLRLKQGELSGSLVARYKPEHAPSTNEVQSTTGDPNLEANWQTKGFFKSGRAELDGYTPGVVVWVRVRTVGLRGVMGPWSDPAQIRLI